jgi:hypothetical protein
LRRFFFLSSSYSLLFFHGDISALFRNHDGNFAGLSVVDRVSLLSIFIMMRDEIIVSA